MVSIDAVISAINKFECKHGDSGVYYIEYSIVEPDVMERYINPITTKLNLVERRSLDRVVCIVQKDRITVSDMNNAKAIMQSIIKKQTSIADKVAWLTVFATGCWWEFDDKQLLFDFDIDNLWDCARKWALIKRNFRRHRKIYTNTDIKSCKGGFSIY